LLFFIKYHAPPPKMATAMITISTITAIPAPVLKNGLSSSFGGGTVVLGSSGALVTPVEPPVVPVTPVGVVSLGSVELVTGMVDSVEPCVGVVANGSKCTAIMLERVDYEKFFRLG